MKRILFLLTTIISGAAIYAQQINDPNAELREAKNFHAINVSSAFNVYIDQANDEAVAVSASNAKDREMIKVEVKDGVLTIGLEKGFRWSNGNKKLKAYISCKKIDKITVSGACDVYVAGVLKLDELTIHQSGASDFKGKLDIGKLTVDLSGASDFTVTGTATQLSVEASGASDFKGYDLVTEICDARASGASDIRITVNKELSAQASGASDVKYKGNGVIKDIRSSGSSSVSKG
jgi:Putative auto-transporter adhesin, head GIN domain